MNHFMKSLDFIPFHSISRVCICTHSRSCRFEESTRLRDRVRETAENEDKHKLAGDLDELCNLLDIIC